MGDGIKDAAYYRELARLMLAEANLAKNAEARKEFLALAVSWQEMADRLARGQRKL